ncbi:MAG: carbohydrate-binding protein [Clostridiaceae bacterium]|nr:carbohydrate-binding protein [Clostridiaceae bacterium]
MKLIAKWDANKNNNTITFENVDFGEGKRGITLNYRTRMGTGTLDILVDNEIIAVSAFTSTAQDKELEDTKMEIPLVKGVHNLTFVCNGWGYFDSFEFTEESPFDVEETSCVVEERNTYTDLMVATDMLGRKVPEAGEVREKREKFVGVFYWTWRCMDIYANPRNLTQILKEHPEAEYDINHPIWTNNDMVHWNEPFYGFYRNDDPYVLRKHAQYFADAGVDCIIFDCTNGSFLWRPSYMPLLEEFEKARRDGIKVPKVAFLMNFAPMESTLNMLRSLYQDLYKPGKYKDLWFYWKGKPLVMAYPESIPQEGKCEYDTKILNEIRKFFTFRPGQPGYGRGPQRNDDWAWLEIAPLHGYVKQEDGTYEMCAVGVAQNANDERICTHFNDKNTYGRSYTLKDRFSKLAEDSYKYGYNLQEQWDYAMEIDPEFVFVTGWNEWNMGKFPGPPWVLDLNSTQIAFVDQYDREHSRDIEPDIDGYLDTYYLLLAANIRRFKGLEPADRKPSVKTIDIMNFDDWKDVKPEYVAHKGTASKRDYPGIGDTYYKIDTGRNDFVLAKVAKDDSNYYFYAECSNNITPDTDENWMCLLIDKDRSKETGWEGYDILVSADKIKVYKDGEWVVQGTCRYSVQGNKMCYVLPKDLVGDGSFEFKWSDNITFDDIMNFYKHGDCAPFGRFNYVCG